MQTYTVYEPRPAPENIEDRAASLVFVKEGFSLGAALLPLVWLLVNRLWLASLAYVGLISILSALVPVGVSQEAVSLACLVVNLIIGFEARDLLRGSLESNGYVLRAVVSGRSLGECEQRFLQEWLPDARMDRARRDAGMEASTTKGTTELVIGMFPAHGG